jgi:hypothetical protein
MTNSPPIPFKSPIEIPILIFSTFSIKNDVYVCNFEFTNLTN